MSSQQGASVVGWRDWLRKNYTMPGFCSLSH